MTERGEGWKLKGGARSSRNRSSLVLHAELIRLISLKIRTLLKLPGSGFIGETSGEFGELMRTALSGEDQHHLPRQRGAQLEQNFTFFKHTKKKIPSNEPSSDKRPHYRRK